MSEESNLEDAGQAIQSSQGNQVSSKQTSIEDINVARNVPESKVRHWAYFKTAFTSTYRCR